MRKHFEYFLLFLCILCLAGCGRQNQPSQPETTPEGADWKNNGFSVSGEVREEQCLWPEKYIPWQHMEPLSDAETEDRIWHIVEGKGSIGSKIYRLHTLSGPLAEPKEYMEIYDTTSGQTEMIELSLENIGVEADRGGAWIGEIAVVSEEEFAIEFAGLEIGENGQIVFADLDIVYSDLHGTAAGVTDVLSPFLEKNIAQAGNGIDLGQYKCDAAGNLYARTDNDINSSKALYVIDREGSLLIEQAYTEAQEIGNSVRTPEGELIFPVYDRRTRSTDIVWFDLQSKSQKVLAQLEGEMIAHLYGMQGSTLYYENGKGIVKWDTVSGERVLAYRLDEMGIMNVFDTMMAMGGEGSPVFRMYGSVNDEEEDWLAVLSSERIERAEDVRIAVLGGDADSRVKTCTAVASRRNPNFSYTYESAEGQDSNDFRTRIMAEIVAGGGPDILYVTAEDMRLLQNQGALLDLNSLLSAETLDQVLPGALELGREGDALLGVTPEISVGTLITLDTIWQEKTWRTEDILDLMDTGEYIGMICQGSGAFASRALLVWLTKYSLGDSFLIDWEAGECHFEDERFLRILRAAKEFGAKEEPDRETYGLGPGKCAADCQAGSNLKEFNTNYKKFGEHYFFVGLSTEGSCGNYLFDTGMVVVNRNTANPEAVASFLECLIGEEVQNTKFYTGVAGQISIRKIDEGALRYSEDGREAWWNGQEVTIKEDGSTTLHDFKVFLESCVPGPRLYPFLEEIIWEEAQAYLEGDKKAEDVAATIDSRIQVYLDEQK